MAGSKSDLSNGSASPKSEPSLRSARKGSVSDLFQIRKVVQCLFSTIHPHKHPIMYHRKGFGGWLNFLSIKDSIKQRSGSGLLTVKSKNTLAKTLKPGQNMSIRLCGIVCVCVCVCDWAFESKYSITLLRQDTFYSYHFICACV